MLNYIKNYIFIYKLFYIKINLLLSSLRRNPQLCILLIKANRYLEMSWGYSMHIFLSLLCTFCPRIYKEGTRLYHIGFWIPDPCFLLLVSRRLQWNELRVRTMLMLVNGLSNLETQTQVFLKTEWTMNLNDWIWKNWRLRISNLIIWISL